jgi:hypothetical protein
MVSLRLGKISSKVGIVVWGVRVGRWVSVRRKPSNGSCTGEDRLLHGPDVEGLGCAMVLVGAGAAKKVGSGEEGRKGAGGREDETSALD